MRDATCTRWLIRPNAPPTPNKSEQRIYTRPSLSTANLDIRATADFGKAQKQRTERTERKKIKRIKITTKPLTFPLTGLVHRRHEQLDLGIGRDLLCEAECVVYFEGDGGEVDALERGFEEINLKNRTVSMSILLSDVRAAMDGCEDVNTDRRI